MLWNIDKKPQSSIYLTLDRDFYVPGQTLNGIATIKFLQPISPCSIALNLIGFQHAEIGGKKEQYFSRSSITYRQGFTLGSIPLPTKKGTNYELPFSINLPGNLNGTFICDEDCFALFILQVVLKGQDEQMIESKQFPLSIIEIPSKQLKSVETTKAFDLSMFCGLISMGKVQISVKTDKNFVKTH